MDHRWLADEMPLGTMDPMFLHELALELNMTVGELKHGRGTPMSAHELCIEWPLYYEARKRERDREEQKAEARRGSGRFGR